MIEDAIDKLYNSRVFELDEKIRNLRISETRIISNETRTAFNIITQRRAELTKFYNTIKGFYERSRPGEEYT